MNRTPDAAPTVTIITPYLNGEAYLSAAIASVQAQTFGDWELLLVDDGSSDGGPHIAAQAAAADARIRLIAPDPARNGAAAARNRALAAARGKYVAFLDADDLFEPVKLATEVAILERMPQIGWVYGPTLFWWPSENRETIQDMRRQAGRTYQPPALLGPVLLEQLGEVSCICSVMIRRQAIEAVGGFEEGFKLYEDQRLWVKLMLRYPLRVIGDVHARYRQHADSTCSVAAQSGEFDWSGAPHASRLQFLTWAADYTRAAGRMSPALEGAFRRAFQPYDQPAWAMRPIDRLTLRMRRTRDGLVRRRRALRRALRGLLAGGQGRLGPAR